MKQCHGMVYENLGSGCKACDEFMRCLEFRRAKDEKQSKWEAEKKRTDERIIKYLTKKGY